MLLATPERPRHKGCSFPWAAFFSDGRHFSDERVQVTNDNATVTVDFRFLRARDDRAAATWVQKSDQEQLKDRLLWVVGEPGPIEGLAREFARSEHMVKRYGGRRESLTKEKARLLLEEEARFEELEKKVLTAVGDAFLDGKLFFRGQPLEPRTLGSAFAGVLVAAAQRILPALYPLLHRDRGDADASWDSSSRSSSPARPTSSWSPASGSCRSTRASTSPPAPAPSPRASSSSSRRRRGRAARPSSRTSVGRPTATRWTWSGPASPACSGPARSASGPDGQPEITSINDPGTRDLFRLDRDLRNADIFPAREGEITARDKVAIRNFFKNHLDLDLQPRQRRLRRRRLPAVPGAPRAAAGGRGALRPAPGPPAAPGCAPEAREGARGLPPLAAGGGDGHRGEEAPRRAVRRARAARHLPQRADRGLDPRRRRRRRDPRRPARAAPAGRSRWPALEPAAERLVAQLEAERPWRSIASVAAEVAQLEERYVEVRRSLLNRQNKEAEGARGRVKARTGFEKLAADQAHGVLRPIAEALFDTTPEAVAPSLSDMQARFPQRLAAGEEAANERLDELLSKLEQGQVVKVEVGLRGREIRSRDELKRVLDELEERIGPQLDKGARIRLV